MTVYPVTMYGIRELRPGRRWRQLYDATWPAYRRWYRTPDGRDRPGLETAAAALARHMPELLPTWARLSEQTEFDLEAATMLTHWDLPAFAPAACSQVVTMRPEPALLRNYDYRPDLFEATSVSTDYLQPVIGTGDCLWGLLDGMNASGLVVSLTFGGDRTVGPGFAVPLVVRYLLETCAELAQVWQALRRLPVAMTYNLTVLDRNGDAGTVHVGPGLDPEFRPQPFATNHRWRTPVDPAHAARYRSIERLDRLSGLLHADATADQLSDVLLQPPLYTRDYAHGFGTLYTAEYRPSGQELSYRWPGRTWRRTFDSPEDSITVELADGPDNGSYAGQPCDHPRARADRG